MNGGAEPRWLTVGDVLLLHEGQILRYGGDMAVRDKALLESAVEVPRFVFRYGQEDVSGLAAALLFALCKNHPFIDGNKRTATVSAFAFLELNGHTLAPNVSLAELEALVLAVARGEASRETVADVFRKHLVPL